MARTDAMVLGAGIVGTSVALHLVKRGMSVALVDRAGVGEQTSYGNAGVIEGNTLISAGLSCRPSRAHAHRAQARRRRQLSSFLSPACRIRGCSRSARRRGRTIWRRRRG